MSKIMFTREDINKKTGRKTGHMTTYLTGTVTKLSFPDAGAERRPAKVVANTKHLESNGGTKQWVDCDIELAAWGENIDRLERMHLPEGGYVTFRCGDISEYTSNGNTRLQASYWGAMYTGYWEIDDPDYPDLIILSGFPMQDGIQENPDGSATITIKARSFVDGGRQDVIFNLNVKANAFNTLKRAGFNQFCQVSAVGTMINDETMDVRVVDFYKKPRPEKNSGFRKGGSKYGSSGGGKGYSKSRGSSKSWGSSHSGFEDE